MDLAHQVRHKHEGAPQYADQQGLPPCVVPVDLGGDLRLHFPDQFCQLFLTLGFRFRVDIPGHALAIEDGGVTALPQVVVDLADTAGARFAPLSLAGLECAGRRFLGCHFPHGLRFGSPDPPVDLVRRALPHGIGDVGVGVQGKPCRIVAQRAGQRFHVHPAFQRQRCEGMSEVVEPDVSHADGLQNFIVRPAEGVRVIHGSGLGRWEQIWVARVFCVFGDQ